MGNWCPRIKKTCRKDCIHFRQGLRYYETTDENGKVRKPVPFEDCGFNIAFDCLENLIERSIGQQGALEQTRNGINQLNQLFYQLVNIKLLKSTEESNIVDGETV